MFKFDSKLSWDGVTILAIGAAALISVGRLQEKVDYLQATSDNHTIQLDKVKDDVGDTKIDVTSLRAIVEERTGRKMQQ